MKNGKLFLPMLFLLSLLCGRVAAQNYPSSDYELEGTTLKSWKNKEAVTIDLTIDENLKNVTEIAGQAFLDCRKLEKIKLPVKLVTIGSTAFQNCVLLKEVTLPASVETIGNQIFMSCYSLERVHVHASNQHFTSNDGILYCKRDANSAQFDALLFVPYAKTGVLSLSETITRISDYAVEESQLDAIALTANVDYIGNSAFQKYTKLEAIFLSDRLTQIVAGSFNGASGIKTITLPASLYKSNAETMGIYSLSGGFETLTLLSESPYYVEWEEPISASKSKTIYVPQAALANYNSNSFWKDFTVEAIPNHTLSLGTSSHGTFTVKQSDGQVIDKPTSLARGTKIVVTASPDDGYIVDRITVGKFQGVAPKLEARLEEDVTVNVTFKRPEITVLPIEHGSINVLVNGAKLTADTELKVGDLIDVNVNRDPGYDISFMRINGHGYLDANASFTLSESITIYAELVKSVVERYNVPFKILDANGNTPLAHVEIKAGNEKVWTDEKGEATLKLPKGDYNVQISKSSYGTVKKTVTVDNSDLDLQTITLSKESRAVKITVLDAETKKALKNVVFACTGYPAETDENGEITLNMTLGTHNYKLQLADYKEYSGVIEVKVDGVAPIIVELQPIKYSVKFIVRDSETDQKIVKANIEINGNNLETDQAEGAAYIELRKGTYPYKVTHDGYQVVDKELVVDENTSTVQVKIPKKPVLPTTYPVNFLVLDKQTGLPLSGVVISLDGKSAETDDKGKATLEVEAGSKEFTLKKDNYSDTTVLVEVAASIPDVEVKMSKESAKKVKVIFTVTHDSQPLADVRITIADLTLMTDDQGSATFELAPNASYQFVCKKDGYQEIRDKVDVVELQVHKPLEMVAIKDQTPVCIEAFSAATAYPNPFDDVLIVKGLEGVETLSLLSIDGRLIREIAVNGRDLVSLSVKGLYPGVYLIRLAGQAGIRTIQLIQHQ